jgi:hypothetical protein
MTSSKLRKRFDRAEWREYYTADDIERGVYEYEEIAYDAITALEAAEQQVSRQHQAARRWWKQARQERDEVLYLSDILDGYRNGYQGSCTACEPVAKKNQWLRDEQEYARVFMKKQAEDIDYLCRKAKAAEQQAERLAEALEETLRRIREFRIWFEDEYIDCVDADNPLIKEVARLGLYGRAETVLDAHRESKEEP